MSSRIDVIWGDEVYDASATVYIVTQGWENEIWDVFSSRKLAEEYVRRAIAEDSNPSRLADMLSIDERDVRFCL